MGNMCSNSSGEIQTQISFPPSFSNALYIKCPTLSIRMGEVQKLNSTNVYQPNRFLFILPIKQSEQLCKIQCPVVSSPSHHLSLNVPILSGIDTVRLNGRSCPIIDLHDLDNDRQIMHKFTKISQTNDEKYYLLKVYPFTNYHQDVFKNGLYQAYLYRCIETYTRIAILKDFFIIEKGEPQSLVFVFRSFLASLEDILMYRAQFNIPYSTDEQLFIADQILSKYKILLENNIVHRDIRPSKIYLADSSQSAHGQSSISLSYQLINLQSSRKLSSMQTRMQEQDQDGRMLMSIRGVPLYCSTSVLEYHIRKEQTGMYNPWLNDRVQLAKMFAMLVTLRINDQQINYEEVKRKNKYIYNLIMDLQNIRVPMRNIIRDFHSNLGVKLPFSLGILQSDQNICKTKLVKFIREGNESRIEKSTTQVLYILHHQQLLHQKVTKTLNNNFQENQSYNNVAILDRMGKYYEGMGIFNNAYYQDQINLLIQLSQEARQMCLPNDDYLNEARKLYADKFNGEVNDPVINIDYKVQNAYSALKKDDLGCAHKIIDDAFVEGASSKIPIATQIKLLQTKGIIQTMKSGPDAGSFFYKKGLDLCNNDTTSRLKMRSLSNFQYLLGKNCLTRINVNKGAMTQDQQILQLTNCQLHLNKAKEIKQSIANKNPIPLAHVYEALGDHCILKQNHKGARNFYEQANNLYINSTQEIGREQQIRMLQKLYKYYHEHSDNYAEQEKVKSMIQNLKKKNEVRQSIDHRKIFQRIRQLKQQKKHRIFTKKNRNSVIQQVDELSQQESSNFQKSHRFSQPSYPEKQKSAVDDHVSQNHGQEESPSMEKEII